ncbi:head decoration protein [Methylobacterium brachiatum]|uniref:head decoration protein n=1 Tax=Methylobacterium brachiatum TaxID=269660 RepID=UPI0024468B9C|nr:head decoration protein [Methylobacterium brachiatum]MDH2313141.1 head decoration protein [Methylobacterium brachiatum]
MTVFTNFHPTALYAGDFPRVTRGVIIASGANPAGAPLKRGTPLGRVTATDKYIPSVKTATDGSQVPTHVLTFEVDASAADQKAKAYETGEFAGEVMPIDASWTIQTLDDAFRIAGRDIFIRSVGAIG